MKHLLILPTDFLSQTETDFYQHDFISIIIYILSRQNMTIPDPDIHYADSPMSMYIYEDHFLLSASTVNHTYY